MLRSEFDIKKNKKNKIWEINNHWKSIHLFLFIYLGITKDLRNKWDKENKCLKYF